MTVNLLSIEYRLRVFLSWANLPEACGYPAGHRLGDFRVGDEFVVGAFTNYESLSQLVKKFNQIATSKQRKTVDQAVVRLRNALAHGRLTREPDDEFFRLIKFSKCDKKNGKVRVEYHEVLDQDWITKNQKLLSDTHYVLADARP